MSRSDGGIRIINKELSALIFWLRDFGYRAAQEENLLARTLDPETASSS